MSEVKINDRQTWSKVSEMVLIKTKQWIFNWWIFVRRHCILRLPQILHLLFQPLFNASPPSLNHLRHLILLVLILVYYWFYLSRVYFCVFWRKTLETFTIFVFRNNNIIILKAFVNFKLIAGNWQKSRFGGRRVTICAHHFGRRLKKIRRIVGVSLGVDLMRGISKTWESFLVFVLGLSFGVGINIVDWMVIVPLGFWVWFRSDDLCFQLFNHAWFFPLKLRFI